jgi:hypothetical protein
MPGNWSDSWSINSNSDPGLQSVTFRGSGNPTGLTVVPAPVSGGWRINGVATLLGAIAGSQLQLTPDMPNAAGSAFWPTPVASAQIEATFDFTIDSGTGADGLAFVMADAALAAPTSLGVNGAGYGFAGIPGEGVAFATAPSSMVGIGPGGTDLVDYIIFDASTTAVPSFLNVTHRARVSVLNGVVTVYIDGLQVLSQLVSLPPQVLIGFSAGTGGLTDRHAVSNVSITAAR